MRMATTLLLVFLTTAIAHSQSSTSDPLAGWLTHVERLVPSDMAKFETTLPSQLTAANDAIEQWAVDRATFRSARSSDEALAVIRQLLDAKRRVDRLLDTTIELRTQAAANADPDTGRNHIRSFLRTCSRLIDLSGRLRYLQNDALQQVASRYAATPSDRARMVELLIQYRSSIGAMVCADVERFVERFGRAASPPHCCRFRRARAGRFARPSPGAHRRQRRDIVHRRDRSHARTRRCPAAARSASG